MKRIYKTLVEAIPQAKRGSRNAQYKSLLDWLRVGRGVRVISVVAILLSALWLAACGDNTSAERSSGNGPENNGDKIENPSAGQEQGMSNEVEFGAENIEKAGQTAGFSILKEAAEYLTEEDAQNATFLDTESSMMLAGDPDSHIITNYGELHGDASNIENIDASRPTVEITYGKGLGADPDETYLMTTLSSSTEDAEKDGPRRKQVASTFTVDDEKFDFFSDKDKLVQAAEELEKGQLEGLSVDHVFYQEFGNEEEDVDWVKRGRRLGKRKCRRQP